MILESRQIGTLLFNSKSNDQCHKTNQKQTILEGRGCTICDGLSITMMHLPNDLKA